MTPGAHLLASWLIGEALHLPQRERRLVTLAGVIPDLDGIGIFADFVNSTRGRPTFYYDDFHHTVGHNLAFGLLVAACIYLLARHHRLLAMGAGLLAYQLHLLFDLAGSLGPDGDHWAIVYLYPFSRHLTLTWSGQWALNGWQNLSIFGLLFMGTFWVSIRKRYSFVEFFSPKLDKAFFALLNRWWPNKQVPSASAPQSQ